MMTKITEMGTNKNKSMNSTIKKTIKMNTFLFLLILLISAPACNEDEPLVFKPPIEEEIDDQYGLPFDKVPETSDIVMYEVNVQAFSNAGNLKGVTNRLDSIQALGINVIWLMPIYPIGELKGVGSPYAVSDYVDVNPEFGTLADLRDLVEKAHELDMAVILDWVANHTAWDHEWIANSSWYTHDTNGDIVSPNGWNDVADLNFESEEMQEEMIDAMKYWVVEANIDGYRCDYADGVPVDFWTKALAEVDAIPDRDLIFFAEGTRVQNFQAGFDLNFGWNFYSAVKDVYEKNNAVSKIYSAHVDDYKSIPEGAQMLHFIDNHDFNAWENTPQGFFDGDRGAMAAFVLSAYVGGVPLLYNGQEIAYPNQISFFYKTPIDWSINPEVTMEYKKILGIRKASEAVRKGSLVPLTGSNDIAVFKRVLDDEEVIVLVNVRNKSIDFELPDGLAQSSWMNQMNQTEINFESSFTFEPYSYYILKN
jgi:glycosidase